MLGSLGSFGIVNQSQWQWAVRMQMELDLKRESCDRAISRRLKADVMVIVMGKTRNKAMKVQLSLYANWWSFRV
jgi:hypothetical protein